MGTARVDLALVGLTSQRWVERAACRHDPDLWFNGYTTRRAAHICLNHCPVLRQCRDEVKRKRPLWGVEGGVAWICKRNSNFLHGRPRVHQPDPVPCDTYCEPYRSDRENAGAVT